LIASFATTFLLRYEGMGWRGVARLAALVSFCGCAIMYLFVTDSPGKLHDPQNPVKETFPELKIFTLKRRHLPNNNGIVTLSRTLSSTTTTTKDIYDELHIISKIASGVFFRNILPSIRSVLRSGTFWAIAIAHSGGLMVCTSVRMLGTYFRDTSYGVISENQAGAVTLFLSVGVLVGLFFGGNAFSDLSHDPRAKKSMIAKLYLLTVIMCYSLAFLAIPFVRTTIIKSPSVVAFLQAIATFFMGAGVAVQVYCIPGIVSATFGANKAMYTSYTDGVACIVSSIVWNIVGNAVEEGNAEGSGWAYGWAAVALLVVLAGFLMVEFVEYYFCRGYWIGRHNNNHPNTNTNTNEDNYPAPRTDFSFSDDTSVSKLAVSGKRIWESRHVLFRQPSVRRADPEMHSILSTDADDDDDTSTILFEHVSSEISHPDDLEHKHQITDTKERIAQLLRRNGNGFCVDCKNPHPRWVSIITRRNFHDNSLVAASPIGCFCCGECAGSHRKLGTHIVFVRSIDHDSFKSTEIEALENGGNVVVNRFYEALLSTSDGIRLTPSSMLDERERFIVLKYEKKQWYQSSNHDIFERSNKNGFEIELVRDHNLLTGGEKQDIYSDTDIKNSPSSVVNANSSIYDQDVPVDQRTRDQYESFVQHKDEDSVIIEFSTKDNSNEGAADNVSLSSGESDSWHISHGEKRGLDDYIDF